jgi:hypothetical protein
MKAMRWVGLAALLAIGVVLLASTPAQARVVTWGPYQLANVGDEPQASGEATLTKVEAFGVYADGDVVGVQYTAVLTVKCTGLTPGATYSTPVGTFQADRKGKGSVRGQVDWGSWGLWVVVARMDGSPWGVLSAFI